MAGTTGSKRIRVNPPSIRKYGEQAQTQFESIRTQLEKLVVAVATVDYEGENAYSFKTKSGEMASEFSNALLKDMQKVADAVRTSTSNIARSLGGQPVTISVDGSRIVPPSIARGDESSQASTDALQDLRDQTVKPHFDRIIQNLQAHQKALESTDWQGQAKDGTVEAVGRFTKAAVRRSEDAKRELADYITQQVSVATDADTSQLGS